MTMSMRLLKLGYLLPTRIPLFSLIPPPLASEWVRAHQFNHRTLCVAHAHPQRNNVDAEDIEDWQLVASLALS